MKFSLSSFLFFTLIIFGCGNNKPIKESNNSSTPDVSLQKTPESNTTYSKTSFKILGAFRIIKNKFSSNYQAEDDSIINNQVPKEIYALNDTNIEISGYAFPIGLEKGKCSAFVLMSILPNCCFGDILNLNQIIYIDAAKDLKEIKSQQFINVKGKLSIGMTEVSTWGDKFLYTLVADKVMVEK